MGLGEVSPLEPEDLARAKPRENGKLHDEPLPLTEGGLLGKLQATPEGLTAAPVGVLTPGERQFALALESSGMAVAEEYDGRLYYLIDRAVRQRILEWLAEPGLPLRASARKAAAGA